LEISFCGSSRDGIKLLVDGRESVLSFADFPWFRGATSAQLSVIEARPPDHVRWPLLDVDVVVVQAESDFRGKRRSETMA